MLGKLTSSNFERARFSCGKIAVPDQQLRQESCTDVTRNFHGSRSYVFIVQSVTINYFSMGCTELLSCIK